MANQYYLPRISDSVLDDYLQARGAVLIQGPKWCGKKTTAEQKSKSCVYFSDPKKKQLLKDLLTLNYEEVINGPTPRLFDEWQLAPELWDIVRFEVDHRKQMGQFILTGSTVPPKSDLISHSGVGRIAKMIMRTMSLYESGDSNGKVSLQDLFEGKSIACSCDSKLSEIAYLCCRGGWPSTVNLAQKAALNQSKLYIEEIISSDISEIDGLIKDQERAKKLLKSYSRNIASQATLETIRQDIIGADIDTTFSQNTLYTYLNALTSLFVIEDAPAWNPNLRSKIAIRSTPTRYFVDPAIATASLGIGPKDLEKDKNTFGLIFENLCVRDLRIYSQLLSGTVYHYRDNTSLECDCVIHLDNGKYGLIEVKLGSLRAINEGAKNLIALKNKIDDSKMGKPSFLMILTAVGDYAYKRPEDGIYIVPITCLKP